MSGLTHIDKAGNARMVDVGEKADTKRTATAEGWVRMAPETLSLIRSGAAKKGDVLGVAQLAGIMGSKRTADLIPLCHPLPLSGVTVTLSPDEERQAIRIEATARTTGKTGIEMEALTAVTTAALTVYDMVKAVDRGMTLDGIRLLRKEGGKSGTWVVPE